MAQSYPDIPETRKQNLSRAEFLARDDAVRSCFSGGSAPAAPVVGQFWFNDSTGHLYQYFSGVWRLVGDRFETEVWPEDFGAVGDGSTDDSAALTEYFTAVNAGKTGRLRRGATYNTGSGYWVLNNSCRIIGEGRESCLKRPGEVLHPLLTVTCDFAFLKGFRMTSAYSGAPTATNNNTPLRADGADMIQLEDIWTDGRFYLGAELTNCVGIVAHNIFARGHKNRQFYISGTSSEVLLSNIHLDGREFGGSGSYGTYGLNINPFFGSAGRLAATNIFAKNLTHQGIAMSADYHSWTLSNCIVSDVTDSSGVGILAQAANGNANQHGVISGVSVQGAAVGVMVLGCYYVDVLGAESFYNGVGLYMQDSQYCAFANSIAQGNTSHGVRLVGGSPAALNDCDLFGVRSISNGGYGFLSDANCWGVRDVACRAIGNTSGNYSLVGTGGSNFARV